MKTISVAYTPILAATVTSNTMPMSSDDIIHHMACDISQWITHFVPDRPYPTEPADAYTDTVCIVFGDHPSEKSVLTIYRKGNAAKKLQKRLNNGWETDLVTLDAAEKLIRVLIRNNIRSSAID